MQKNRIEIAGFLAAKPVLRFLPSGTPVANVRLGESYTFKDSDGKPRKHTNWHSLSFYGDLSAVAVGFEKGDNIFAEGSIEQRQFIPKKDGVQRTIQEIVVRACHIIAPSRGNGATKTAAQNDAIEEHPQAADSEAGVADHDLWPVA
ncbi:MAG TPA: single-stranded DNA-binding protein [Candidatus Acidoferrales bacterium]|nr:single-stranded DNA-binding protein [Candidatus Acidoferrales bacterium]